MTKIQTIKLTPGQIAMIVEALHKQGSTDAKRLADLVEDATAIVMARKAP